MRFTKRHTVAAFAFVAIATLGLSACSGAADMTEGTSPTTPATSSSEPSTPAMTADPAANLVGPGCAGYAEANPTGPGSVVGMSADPVAVAASNNPLLTTLVAAVSGQLNPEVDLVDTLNGSEFTVFAPVDDAFAQIDPATIDMLKTPEGADTLSKILTYHVVAGQIMPDELMGDLKTVEGGTVNITGSGDKLQVNGANVICGGVQTANATVYLIDTVLMPGN